MFVALFTTFEMQKDDKIIFVFEGDDYEHCDMQNGSFQKIV